MSTNSTITVRTADNERKSIYCHWDGYPSNNGAILLEHYNTLDKVKELVELGDLSALREKMYPNLNKPHDFYTSQDDVCIYYGRDRGEGDTKPLILSNSESLLKPQQREYNYYFDGEKWFLSVKGRKGKVELTRKMCSLPELEKVKMLSNEEIADHLLSDMEAYKENIKEIIIGRLMDSSNVRTYWDAWFRGAVGKDLENADNGI